MELETLVLRNADNIDALTKTMSTLAATVEQGEKRHNESIEVFKSFMQGIGQKLDKVAALDGDFGHIKEDVADLKTESRTARHDINNALANGVAIAQIQKDVSGTKTTTDSNEKRLDRQTEKLENQGRDISDNKAAIAGVAANVQTIMDWKLTVQGGVAAGEKIGGWLWAVFGIFIIFILAVVFKSAFSHIDPNAVLGALGE